MSEKHTNIALPEICWVTTRLSDETEYSHTKVERLILDKHKNKLGAVESVLLPEFCCLVESEGQEKGFVCQWDGPVVFD